MSNRSQNILLVKVITAFTALAVGVPALANPQEGVVTGGVAKITETGPQLDIHQQTNNVVIDWRTFNIDTGEVTQFHQPSANAIAVNRIHDQNPSMIFGQLTANGNIVLSSANGVLFGHTARVDVNRLLASTAIMADSDIPNFLNDGLVTLNQAGNKNSFIINNGRLTAADAGLVGLVAPHVENNGIIVTRLGHAHLASGDTATIDFFGDGLIEIAIDDSVARQSVINTGTIYVPGGTIALTAAAGKKIVDSLIVVAGELHAPSFIEKQGKIIIHAAGANKKNRDGNSTAIVSALLNASG